MEPIFIGIDLGTTHSAIFYASDELTQGKIESFSIPQLIAPGQVSEQTLLPSFVYTPHESEFLQSDLLLPWGNSPLIVGQLARELGSKSSGRLVQSAKSWLCHTTVNAEEKVLPIDALDEVPKLSPAQVTEMLLRYLADAWNNSFPNHPIQQQNVVITVPASFDPAARSMTEQASQKIGLNARLIEEPLAAFYAWLSEQEKWTSTLEVNDQVLVIDVGGGTTDLSLIQVTDADGHLQLERIAVGRHILLGGDNMDMSLTYHVAGKLAQDGVQLEAWQISALTQACRAAKETLLKDGEIHETSIVVPSRGRSLLANTIKSSLSRDEVNQVILNGFFPQVGIGERAQKLARSGIRALNLEYEADPAITRHISEFLTTNHSAPNKVLLNGGVFNSEIIVNTLCAQLSVLLNHQEVSMLTPSHLDFAVAKGASYYAQINAQGGIKVKSGLSANYYIGVESPMPAIPGMSVPIDGICIAPFGLEEGASEVVLPNEFSLVVGEDVQFRFFQSNQSEPQAVGSMVSSFSISSLLELSPISVRLFEGHYKLGELVRVVLTAKVTELGILVIEACDTQSDLTWTLEYQVRVS